MVIARPKPAPTVVADRRTRASAKALPGAAATLEAIEQAAAILEADPDFDEEPDDLEPEDVLYDDAPEEANDADADAAEEFRPGAAETDRPAIVFEPYLRPRPPFASRTLGRGDGLRARVRLWQAQVLATGEDRGDAAEEGDLQRLAVALLDLQAPAIAAKSRLEAFESLNPMMQSQLAAAADVDDSTLSRHSNLLVGCPWGVCRLQFFSWRAATGQTDNHRRTNELLELLRLLRAATGDVPDIELARQAVRAASPAASEGEVHRRANTLRRQVDAVGHLLAHMDLVELAWSWFPDVSDEQAKALLGLEGDRGLLLARMVLAGAFR